MTVGELMALLENFDPDAPVRLAMQPTWPFEYTIQDAIEVKVDVDDEFDTVYLVEGEQTRYLPGVVSEHIGWK